MSRMHHMDISSGCLCVIMFLFGVAWKSKRLIFIDISSFHAHIVYVSLGFFLESQENYKHPFIQRLLGRHCFWSGIRPPHHLTPHKLAPYLTGPSLANIQPILVKFWILHLMVNPNKLFDTRWRWRPNLTLLEIRHLMEIPNKLMIPGGCQGEGGGQVGGQSKLKLGNEA